MIESSLRTRESIMVTSKTQKIIDDIRDQIQSGALQPGDQIPSATELRAQYDVSITVVRRAVDHLKAIDLVEGVPGVGVFVKSPD